MGNELELLIRKNALKDVEIWLYQQYEEIGRELDEIRASNELESSDED